VLQSIAAQLKTHLDSQLVDELVRTYKEIKDQFFLGHHEPSELNGGKFCEVVYRILEYITAGGKFTPLGRHIPRLVEKLWQLQGLDASRYTETVRVHIPRVLVSVYEIRNKRGVGHVGGDVNPNLADSTYIAAGADWVMAEFLRLYYGCSLNEAQRIVDSLVQRKVSVVHDYGDVKRVLHPRTKYPDQVLLLLASAAGGKLTEDELIEWTEHSNPTIFRRDVLGGLHKRRLLEWRNGNCTISPTGLRNAEEKHGKVLAELNATTTAGTT
jgi:hypothetical protein